MLNVDLTVLDAIQKKIEPIAEELAPTHFLQYKELVREKTTSNTPNILIYGMYNHGKSTLINALLGEEKAKMARKPTTYACDKYNWKNGGCILIDSPGIEAQKDHTAIAVAKREQCELVAMVVEGGSFEEKLVWNSIVELVQGGQQVCLILNDFDGSLDNHEISARTIETFRTRLQSMARKLNYSDSIVSKVRVEVVNAKRALKGRVEGKQRLIEASGINKIEKLFEELVKSFNSNDVINTLKRNLYELIVICKSELAKKSENILLAEAEGQLSKIILERDYVLLDLERALDDCILRSTSDIHAIFKGDNLAQEMIEHSLVNISQKIGDELSEVVKSRLRNAEINVKGFCDDFKNFQISQGIHSFNINSDHTNADSVDMLNLDWSTTLKTINWESTISSGIESFLKMFKNWFPAVMKGKGPVWIGNIAGLASRILGAAISVIGVIWVIYNEHKAQEEAQAAAIRRAEAIADTVRNVKMHLKKVFMEQLTAGVNDIFEKILPSIQMSVENLRKQCQTENFQSDILEEANKMLGYK